MDGVEQSRSPRRRRRAVGPPGARPAGEEPRPEPRTERTDEAAELERYLAERPPHHEPR